MNLLISHPRTHDQAERELTAISLSLQF
ncbi:hypothetical protein EMIT0158MI4_80322 [Burkholderia ambifaria]